MGECLITLRINSTLTPVFPIATARMMKAITPRDLQRVIVDSTVQKAVAYPTDSRLLEVGRKKAGDAGQAPRHRPASELRTRRAEA